MSATSAERNPAAKVLRALNWLVTKGDSHCGVRELATALKLPPSGAHRLLSILAQEGFVRRDPENATYALGPNLLRLANVSAARSPLGQLAHEPMCELVKASGESALLGQLDLARLELMFVKIVESPVPLRYQTELNRWMPLHAGASGLAMLAWLTPMQVDQTIRRTGLRPVTERTLTDPHRLRETLHQVRQRGFALTRGQRLPGAVGIAAPIFGHDGVVIGDICLTVPDQRFDPANKRLPQLVMACAARVTQDIGGLRP